MRRYAIIYNADPHAVGKFLPANYGVVGHILAGPGLGRDVHTIIHGKDDGGWGLDDYVLPRLATGLYFGQELKPKHPELEQ